MHITDLSAAAGLERVDDACDGSAGVHYVRYVRADMRARDYDGQIRYGLFDGACTPFVVAISEVGVCYIGLGVRAVMGRMGALWPKAHLLRDDDGVAGYGAAIEAVLNGRAPEARIDVHVFGTDFQHRVWQALLKVGRGRFVSYQSLAAAIGAPKAARAVGSAVGANPLSLLVPCHRVVRADGALGHYGWGVAAKRQLLEWECGI